MKGWFGKRKKEEWSKDERKKDMVFKNERTERIKLLNRKKLPKNLSWRRIS